MDRFSPLALSAAIRSAPVLTRLGIAVRDPRLRERAADRLAHSIIEWLERAPEPHDDNQLTLPLS